MGVYATSKFALEGLTEALREEVRPFGVDVSLVEPSFVKTSIVSQPPTHPIAAYTPARQAALQVLSKSVESGMEPRTVAQVILRAATTRPRLRYPVGQDTKMLMLIKRLLPESLFERMRRRAFQVGKPANPESKTRPITSD
jgi:short-subunit dehydrogenase